ncbi:MAG TPA: hypothetical protein VF060_22700 [Trebonia sp.]
MAVVALVLWTLTVAVGVFLLVTSTRVRPGAPEDVEPELESASPASAAVGAAPRQALTATGASGGAAVPAPAVKRRDVFDPPSLREAKSESIPGMRALGEFMHPALAITGFAFWLLYTLVHDRILGAIALGIMLGAIAAGITWAVSNGRAAKREDGDALVFSGRVLVFHVAGAALTLLLAALITARV